LDLMAQRRQDLPTLISELFARVGPHYYDRIDIVVRDDQRALLQERLSTLRPDSIAGLRVTGRDSTDGLRFLLEDGGWALIRLSGTEPLMRLYTEVREERLVQPVLAALKELMGV